MSDLKNPYRTAMYQALGDFDKADAWDEGAAAERARILEVLGNTANIAALKHDSSFDTLMAVKEYIESGAHVKDGK